MSVEEAAPLVEALCVATDNEEARKRVDTLSCTAAKLEEDRPVTGWPSLANLLAVGGSGRVAGAALARRLPSNLSA
jgi:hypothetical protein